MGACCGARTPTDWPLFRTVAAAAMMLLKEGRMRMRRRRLFKHILSSAASAYVRALLLLSLLSYAARAISPFSLPLLLGFSG